MSKVKMIWLVAITASVVPDIALVVAALAPDWMEILNLGRIGWAKKRYLTPFLCPDTFSLPGKTILPSDAKKVYGNAVPNSPKNPTAWFGRSENGQIYRYSADKNGYAHFSGIDGVGDGTRNISQYALDRLDGK